MSREIQPSESGTHYESSISINPPGGSGGHTTGLERRQLLSDRTGPRPVAPGMHLPSPGGHPLLFARFDAESARMCHDRKIVNAAVSETTPEARRLDGTVSDRLNQSQQAEIPEPPPPHNCDETFTTGHHLLDLRQLLRLVQYGDGARASARFNVQ
jgi:hypothetical protein